MNHCVLQRFGGNVWQNVQLCVVVGARGPKESGFDAQSVGDQRRRALFCEESTLHPDYL